ncbi:FtsH protease activity modulator HflK [Idiomarina sp. HP20-50]|uniref:FtsH protease activity modulator HflK n=1 Tax=Idiomarina sp. HP20-50 TaxID=3070813 RepID=UPI00294ADEB8|nr:FtsH protease activity modulator HflK [Idiomarina sp. HP20-50]MDV6317294.1 FtsH protease activity modulator HflK [Idiomarina sp. HP20-50]
MAWNQPGNGNNNDRDPWKNQGGKDQGPPDLDEAVRKLLSKFGFGGKKGGGSGGSSGLPAKGIGIIAIIALIVWFIAGFYTVKEADRGVVLRFGQFHTLVESGLHWRPLFIDSVEHVDVNNIRSDRTEGYMLTQDENVVRVELDVQYRVVDPRAYLFNVQNADGVLSRATDSALRYVVGHTTMDEVLTRGREEVRARTLEVLEQTLNSYSLGLQVVDVNLLPARPPEAVKDAFDDAIAAQEDEERFIREAEAYARKVEPLARGQVRRMLQEAQAYKEQIILEAKGEVARFEELLPQYQNAPKVTRERIYLDTLQELYRKTPKVLVDVEGGNNMMYLPLEKLLEKQGRNTTEFSPMRVPEVNSDGSVNSGTQSQNTRSSDRSGGRNE